MLSFLLLLLAADSPLRVVPAKEGRVEAVAILSGKALDALKPGDIPAEQGERFLRFCVLDSDTGEEGPPMLGSYRRVKDSLVFSPRFPLAFGRRYRATLDLGDGKPTRVEHRASERPKSPAPIVDKIYPTTDVLPANHLKFYLHFSQPMREAREVFDLIRLEDEKGKPVADPWRRTELWSADGKRLTLWIHPGRIKRGVGPREGEGPVLEAGKKYRLVVGKALRDAEGQALGKDHVKEFRAAEEDRKRPLPEEWKLHAPKAGTRDPLRIDFPEPLDRPLLDRFLTIMDDDGKPVKGRVEVGKEERVWLFHPERAWEAGELRLVVDEALEDLAGNSPTRLFDVDLREPAVKPPMLARRISVR